MHTLVNLDIPNGKIAIHWFEQSSFAIKTSDGQIGLIDPYFPRTRPSERFIHADPPLDESQLPADYVLLTHNHGDHTCIESIIRIHKTKKNVRYFGPIESIEKILGETEISGDKTHVINASDVINIGSLKVYVVFAKPPEGDPSAKIDPPDVTHLGFVIESEGVKIYISGDPLNNFSQNDKLIDPIRDLAPQIGFLTNHPTEGEFPFFDGSAEMADRIGLKHAVPVHRSCFVKRNYDANEWAKHLNLTDVKSIVMDRNSHLIYPIA